MTPSSVSSSALVARTQPWGNWGWYLTGKHTVGVLECLQQTTSLRLRRHAATDVTVRIFGGERDTHPIFCGTPKQALKVANLCPRRHQKRPTPHRGRNRPCEAPGEDLHRS